MKSLSSNLRNRQLERYSVRREGAGVVPAREGQPAGAQVAAGIGNSRSAAAAAAAASASGSGRRSRSAAAGRRRERLQTGRAGTGDDGDAGRAVEPGVERLSRRTRRADDETGRARARAAAAAAAGDHHGRRRQQEPQDSVQVQDMRTEDTPARRLSTSHHARTALQAVQVGFFSFFSSYNRWLGG